MSEALRFIQTQLKAPKNQKNEYGGFMYRSCEDILEAVKPLLLETESTLTLDDDIVHVGDRYYIKSTASLFDSDDKLITRTTAYAREDENKKGMDGSQVTGTSSSYARKYALNGLFLIDDTKDADTGDNRKSGESGGKGTGGTRSGGKQTQFEKLVEAKRLGDKAKGLLLMYLNDIQERAGDKGSNVPTHDAIKAQAISDPKAFWDGFKRYINKHDKEVKQEGSEKSKGEDSQGNVAF